MTNVDEDKQLEVKKPEEDVKSEPKVEPQPLPKLPSLEILAAVQSSQGTPSSKDRSDKGGNMKNKNRLSTENSVKSKSRRDKEDDNAFDLFHDEEAEKTKAAVEELKG